jgi:hypothetical protein
LLWTGVRCRSFDVAYAPCVPRRDFFDASEGAALPAGVETSLDTARTSAYATSQPVVVEKII